MSALNEYHLADRRVTEWFLRESGQREHREMPARSPHTAPIITISRQFGSGGHSVAMSLQECLGAPWTVWDKEIINRVADSAKVRSEMIEALDEHAHSWMDEMIRRTFGRSAMEPMTYRKHLSQVLLALGHQGHIIIVGRGANFLLPDALNVRLRASLSFRIQSSMAREGLTREAAERKLRQVDHERAEFTRSLFDREIDDPSGYDMVLQTDSLGIDATLAAIIAAAEQLFCLKLPSPVPNHEAAVAS